VFSKEARMSELVLLEQSPLVYAEGNDRRHRFRFSSPAAASIEGQRFALTDWSSAGIAVQGFNSAPAPGGRFRCQLELPDVVRLADVECVVVRRDAGVLAACEISGATPADVEALELAYAAHIAHLKPVAPGSPPLVTGADPQRPPTPEPRRVRGRILVLAPVVALAALGGLLIARPALREPDEPQQLTLTVHAPVSGIALAPALEPGAPVSAGDVLLQITGGSYLGSAAAEGVLVRAPIDAVALFARVKSGDRVERGQVLFLLGPRGPRHE
jgi:biotin carboxyl carrier protein